jgi:hypothetical protein
MDRKGFSCVAVLLLLFLISACGPSPDVMEPSPNVPANTSPEPTSASFAYVIDLPSVSYDSYAVSPDSQFVLTNNSHHDLHNLAIVQAGDPPMRSVDEMTQYLKRDRDEDTLLAIWDFVRRNRYHWGPPDPGVLMHNPAVYLLVFGYGICDDSASAIHYLSRMLDLQSRVVGFDGHIIAEAFYDGDWHMFDADHESYYFSQSRIASVEAIQARLNIVRKGVDSQGLDPAYRSGPETAKIYGTKAIYLGADSYFNYNSDKFGVNLASGERLIWRRAREDDGFFSAYEDPLRPPLYYLFEVVKEFKINSRGLRTPKTRRMEVRTPVQNHPIAGIRLEIENLPEIADESLSLIVNIDGMQDPIVIIPTMVRDHNKLMLSFKYEDLGVNFPVYEMTLTLVSPKEDVNPTKATLMTSYHAGSLFFPRIQFGLNDFKVFLETKNEVQAEEISQSLSFEFIGGAISDVPTSLAQSTIVADSDEVAADGNHLSRITVTLRDADAVPLPNRLVAAESDRSADILYSVLRDRTAPRSYSDSEGKIDFVIRSLKSGPARVSFYAPFEGNMLLGKVPIVFQKPQRGQTVTQSVSQ